MTVDQIKEEIKTSRYDFLRTDPHLGKHICLLTLGGSHAYGTNTENSDVDIRGCATEHPSDIIGMSNFEQVIDHETDTTIYAFNKIIDLFINCNPNSIEILGCKPEHYLYLNDIGKELIENRKLFLSKRCVYSFGGYATSQLRRLENAICHDALPKEKKVHHLAQTLDNVMKSFNKKYGSGCKGGVIRLQLDERSPYRKEPDVYLTGDIDSFPVRSFNAMINELSTIVRTYDKLNGRNKKKDDNHLNKHAMHLVRLYLMAFDILEKEEIITYREKDLDFLMQVRNGYYQKSDGTYDSGFFDIINEYENRLEYDASNTSLPCEPDYKAIEEFVMSVNKRIVNNEIGE